MGARFFVDRALGAHLVPSALRRAGWNIVTMRERYGESPGQAVGDPVWIREATAAGECILTKDARVATRPAEAQTIYMCDARVFAFAKAGLIADQMIAVLLTQGDAIQAWANRTPGPFVAALRADLPIQRRRLNYPP